MPNRLLLPALCVALAVLDTGCSLLIGNIKASARKSDDYEALDLSKGNADWRRLDPAKESAPSDAATSGEATDVSDLSFQSQKTASIVSLTSTCRSGTDRRGRDLRADTRQLLLGFTHITEQDEKEIQVGGRTGLQTTVQGKINSRAMRIRAVVLEAENCIYDLMLIARPDRFETVEADFGRFVSSFRLD